MDPPARGGTPSGKNRASGFWSRWLLGNTVIGGILALGWLLLRSGTKPSRFTYPCQQAAVSTAALAFGTPFVAAVVAARRRVTSWVRSPLILTAAALGMVVTLGVWAYLSQAKEYHGAILDPPRDYRAQVFHVSDCPQDPAGDRFVGLDNLLATLSRGGTQFYRSNVPSPFAGSGGIVGPRDVVLIKINYQWDQRGGTNTDLLRGLIRKILDHPDGFDGEIVVCENAQFASVQGFDRSQNNAQDIGLSPHDVVVHFQDEGDNVSHYDWTAIHYTSVGEYSEGDLTDGYVVGDYDADVQGRVSYPKFRTAAGTYISLKYGIWNPLDGTYSRDRLRFINMPVLKSHHAVYGATVSVKDYMGVVTRELGTNSHNGIRYGILGALIGEIGPADLNIVDAIWINARPDTGPGTSYAQATRRDELVASLDPVALDIWSVKNILIPGFLDNGYTPPWPNPSADPDDPTSTFRQYLDNSMYQILEAGYTVTNDLDQIDLLEGSGSAGDFDGDGDVDAADYAQFVGCFTGEGGGPVGPSCAPADFDGDGDVDCTDRAFFDFVWTDPGAPPEQPECAVSGLPPDEGTGPGGELPEGFLSPAVPNPISPAGAARPATRVAYSIRTPGRVTVSVVDVKGRLVRTLVDESERPGEHAASWDGRDEGGRPVARGVYSLRVAAPGFEGSRKVVVR
jgi:hypothetical protein